MSVIGIDPLVVHVHDVHTVVVEEVSLVPVALVSIKVHYHHFADPVQVHEHELWGEGCSHTWERGVVICGGKGCEKARGIGGGSYPTGVWSHPEEATRGDECLKKQRGLATP